LDLKACGEMLSMLMKASKAKRGENREFKEDI